MTTVASIRAHFESRFAGRTVERFPSPHLMVTDIWPSDVYENILRYNPFLTNKGKEWISSSEMKKRRQETPYDHRKQIDLEKDAFQAAPDAKEFWRTVGEALVADDWFAKLMYRTFPMYFDLRFGELVNDAGFWTHLRHQLIVQRHDTGYRIGPHTDSPHRVFTCIFSFADKPGFDEYGTQFVRPRDPMVRCWGDLHHDDSGFEVATVAKYMPNSFVVFFKTRQSFHSVRLVDRELPNQRYGMQLGYYEPRNGLFRDLSRPDLMEDRTAKPLLKVKAFGRTLQINRS